MAKLKVDKYTQKDMGVMMQLFMDAHRWRGIYDNTKDDPNPNESKYGAGFYTHNDAIKALAEIEAKLAKNLPILNKMLGIK